MCTPSLMNNIYSFSVLPFTGLSDHCCISVSIMINDTAETCETRENKDSTTEIELQKNNIAYTYDPTKRDQFIQNILKNNKLSRLNCDLHDNTNLTPTLINNSVSSLNEIITAAAMRTFHPKKVIRPRKNRVKTKGQKWFNKECLKHRRIFRKASEMISKHPFDKNLRTKFVKSRSEYQKVRRKAEKSYRGNLTKALLEVGKSDPRMFWDIVDKMNKWGKEKRDPGEKISPSIWKKHFERLLNSEDDKQNIVSNATLSYDTFEPVLDGIIGKEEMYDALRGMKCKKAPGPDGVITEYLKVFGDIAGNTLLKLI